MSGEGRPECLVKPGLAGVPSAGRGWLRRTLCVLIVIVLPTLASWPQIKILASRQVVLHHSRFGGFDKCRWPSPRSLASKAYLHLLQRGDVLFFRELVGSGDEELAVCALSALRSLGHPEADQIAIGVLRTRATLVARSAVLVLLESKRHCARAVLERTPLDLQVSSDVREYCTNSLATRASDEGIGNLKKVNYGQSSR